MPNGGALADSPGARGFETVADPSHSSTPDWLTADVVDAVALGLVAPDEWVHRRVESIGFIDDQTLLRRASVDFTVGFATPIVGSSLANQRVVPVTLLRKRVLHGFDIRDANGVSVPILTTRENGELASAVLRYTIGVMTNVNVDSIATELGRIATSPTEIAREERNTLLSRLGTEPALASLRALADNRTFCEFTQQFAENFILAALVQESDGRRAVLKFSYEEPAQSADVGRRERFAQAMGWSPREFSFDIPAAVTTESYHVEIRAPEGVLFNGAALFNRGVENVGDDLGEFHPIGVPRRGEPSVHFHVRGEPTANAVVYVWLRIQRRGWMHSAFLATLAVAVLMSLNAWRLPSLLSGHKVGGFTGQTVSTDVAALLMAVVALVLSFAIRLGEHPVTARTALGVRVMTIGAAVMPLIDGWLLAFGPAGDGLQTAWTVTAVASVVLLALVGFAYRGPRAVTPLAYGGVET